MSALAQLTKWGGGEVSGSDRRFDLSPADPDRRKLEKEGIAIFPQDGSGVAAAAEIVVSAAVESLTPDLAAARQLGLPVSTRARFLNRMAEGRLGLAVAGTNGKSTTTALVAWVLEYAGLDPSLAVGACLRGQRPGLGNARLGKSPWFCFEADESDDGLEDYHPEVGVVTGITADHLDLRSLKRIFSGFASNCRRGLVVNGDCPRAASLKSSGASRLVFALDRKGDYRPEDLELGAAGSRFRIGEQSFFLPLPGKHNAHNALAALAAVSFLNISLKTAAAALKTFPGLKRRLETVGEGNGIRVVDDYAHNAAKISAALQGARLLGGRVLAVYQPHGFLPLWSFRRELAAAFSRSLHEGDVLILLPVYYAGGTVKKRFGSEELAALIKTSARLELRSREAAPERLAALARPGDVILVMGARDPGLGLFARLIAGNLGIGVERNE